MQTLGTLTSLDVDNVSVDGQKVSTGVGNLQLEGATGVIEILNTNRISGVGEPVAGADAATKNYVDTAIDGEGVAMALNITGLGYNAGAGGGAAFGTKLVTLLEEIVPASTKVNGTAAKIHATDQTSASATLTASALNTGLDETTVAVDKTVTVATRTVASITKGTLTILTLDAVHGYDAGRNVTITGATGVTAINGTYAINRIVSSTEIEINLDTSSEVGTYTADSASVSRVTETGQENETVLKDVQFSDVTGSVSLTVNRYVLTCTVTAGAWVYTSGVSSAV